MVSDSVNPLDPQSFSLKTEEKIIDQPCYFSSLTVENVRAFKSRQTLNLLNDQGCPAQWTVILGDNGIGKTTLIECLARSQPKELMPQHKNPNGLSTWVPDLFFQNYIQESFIRNGSHGFEMVWEFCVGKKLAHWSQGTLSHARASCNFTPSGGGGSSSMDKISNFTIYAYGAYRRLGIGALSETRDPDPRATLFDESKTLLNVEEWILQADYAAEKSKDPKAKQRLARIIDLLSRRKLLPDVDNIQISAQGINTPIVEAHTSTGWIPLRALSSGYRALIAWVVDLASRLFDRYPESANPLAEPAVVIIDQIHTHPTTRGHKLSSL